MKEDNSHQTAAPPNPYIPSVPAQGGLGKLLAQAGPPLPCPTCTPFCRQGLCAELMHT